MFSVWAYDNIATRPYVNFSTHGCHVSSCRLVYIPINPPGTVKCHGLQIRTMFGLSYELVEDFDRCETSASIQRSSFIRPDHSVPAPLAIVLSIFVSPSMVPHKIPRHTCNAHQSQRLHKLGKLLLRQTILEPGPFGFSEHGVTHHLGPAT